jgi:putative transposase
MERYERCSHNKFMIRYHVVISTKYRKKILSGISEDLLDSFRRAESMQSDWKIEVMELDRDHVHFLIRSTPAVAPFDVVHKLKQVSTYDMWQKHHDYMGRFYWNGHRLWTRGYFIASIGEVCEETIRHYIENQG